MSFIYLTATSLDGFIADSENSLQWLFDVPPPVPEVDPQLAEVSIQVMGATTYQWLLRMEDFLRKEGLWQQSFGQKITYVVTHQDLPIPPGADVRIISGNMADHLPHIREAAGEGDVWIMGGGDLAAQFYQADALDTIVVSLAPVTLGSGAPLLAGHIPAARLHLETVQKVGQFIHATYTVKPAQ